MPSFKYEITALIKLVESKPCIWDKGNEHYKNKQIREQSWQEVFSSLEEKYEQMDQIGKKKLGDVILAKWSNVRDSFIRSSRKNRYQGLKRSYIYSEHLQFLLKSRQDDKDDAGSSFSQDETEYDRCDLEGLCDPLSPPQSASNLHQWKRQLDDDIEQEVGRKLKRGKRCVEQYSNKSQPDHELILLSFQPYIRDMSEEELMDFQMGVLTNIRKIKQQRGGKQESI
ncbi:uncharacterized protein LOC118744557 isoform X1 [Rhagoletis pomonella]|uniref:uncharacterized protein LOC118744557 isoform X1 n=1 Tax=Rhagoletis pomonella TaxID=28610 RepID=UPI0017847FBC|nr:uncharacterized protein LOC118744557 isoform X1 [Rhagoletis pomonella]